LLNQHPEADMVYSDEDKLNQQGQRVEPFFKPDWCPDSFLSRMYTCHLGVYRRLLVEAIGGFRLGFEGSQDYDLVLRLSERTDQIWHLPKVLYHWRNHAASASSSHDAKPYAEAAAKRALAEACQRRGEAIQTIGTDAQYPGVYTIRYKITAHKRVSIIIPTRNLGQVLDRCLQSIFTKTTYPNYEVILVDNGSDEPETLEIIAKWQQDSRFKSYLLDIPFNYSSLNNYAVRQAQGDYLLFLNNDTEVISEDWIEALVEQVQRPTIGAVGGLLLYPDQTIQHAGVVLGLGGVAGHSHKHFSEHHPGYCRQIVSVNNYSAITAACLICRREVFEQVQGFDESLAVAFNDVDFCLKIKQLGYHNVYLPHVKLYHHESKSRGLENTPQKRRRFEQEQETVQQKWHILTQTDSCYSPHLTIDREDYSLKI
jgi:O-antigen biosynthesis protein